MFWLNTTITASSLLCEMILFRFRTIKTSKFIQKIVVPSKSLSSSESFTTNTECVSILPDEFNVLTISPSNNTLIYNLTSVQISLFYDKNNVPERPIIFSLALEQIPGKYGAEDLYITKPFQPPRQPFKIDVRKISKRQFIREIVNRCR